MWRASKLPYKDILIPRIPYIQNKHGTLGISLKFDSLEKMKTSSESKEKLEKTGKMLITSLGFKARVRPHKCKKSRYASRNVSTKDLLKIIKDIEKLSYESYDRKRPKYDPADR